MRGHREILTTLFKARGLTQEVIAKKMGWKSPRTVAHKLRGDRDWATGELERMCEIAGITVVQLAEMAGDIHLTKTRDAVTAPRIVDSLPTGIREAAIQYLTALKPADPGTPAGK